MPPSTLVQLVCAVNFAFIVMVASSTEPAPSTVTMQPSTNMTTVSPSPGPVKPTISPQQACQLKSNTSCVDCMAAGAGCYYCSTTRRCGYYPYKRLIPSHDECDAFSEVYWGICFISLQATVITISVVAGIILISVTVCCCCCCQRRRKNKWLHDMARMEEERRERQERADERRSERKMRTDDVRRKYGLVKDDAPYTRFDH